MEIKLNKFGLLLVAFATVAYLLANVCFFALENSTTFCISSSIATEPIDKARLLKCTVEILYDREYELFIGTITALGILVGTIIVEISHKGQVTISTETRHWYRHFRARRFR